MTVDAPAASSRGAALLGGIASGIWADAGGTAAVAPGIALVAVPDVERVAAYDEVYENYLESIETYSGRSL